jgi:quinol monooxygenase YgiN
MHVMQAYNSREGFMNHRTSNHFVEFMQTSGPFMMDDVDLLEYKSVFPTPVRD